MKRLILCIALLLFVVGTSLATVHNVAHASGEHSEYCGVFHTTPQIGLSGSSCFQFVVTDTKSFSLSLYLQPYVTTVDDSWQSRAPPIS